jgi:type II secretory pathway component PulF
MTDARYEYAALDGKGAKVRGALHAYSEEHAASVLRAQGLAPIRLLRRGQGTDLFGRQIGATRLAEFLHALGALVGAGATMTAALTIYRQQERRTRLRQFSESLEREIASGRSVSDAFRTSLGEEAPFVSALISAGEASGALATACGAAAEQIERDERLKGEFWSAISYPLFILAASVVAILLLLLAVVPSIAPLISEAGGEAPIVLRVMIGVSGFLLSHGFVILTLGLVSLALLFAAARLGLLRTTLDQLVLDGPGASISRRLIYGRFAAIFGRLLSSGVPAHDAFRLAAAGTTIKLARERVIACSQAIFDGARVSQALATCPGFPPGIVRMAAVGEETGALGSMLERAAIIEQEFANRALGSITKWLGPLMILVLGLMIGLVMAGLLTGVSSIGDSVINAS